MCCIVFKLLSLLVKLVLLSSKDNNSNTVDPYVGDKAMYD